MQISFIKILSDPEFKVLKNLYLTAFPSNERREFNELKKQIFNDECIVNLISVGEKIVGLIIFWQFTDFVFIEHIAIEPGMRGQGIGEKTLSEMKSRFQKMLILETELPLDEISRRRIGFYERNGFHLLERNYFQPSYDGIKPEVEMKLMCTSANVSTFKLDEIIQQIKNRVYKLYKNDFTNL